MVLQVVKAQDFQTSQLVDNLNVSVHVRALLTDLFLLDEALCLGVDEATKPGPSNFSGPEAEPRKPQDEWPGAAGSAT